jgi:hypothetical protein
MKLLYTTLAFLCFWNTGFSQSYTPFLVEGKIWIVDYVYEPNGWGCGNQYEGGECLTEYYKLNGDTLINDTSYQILWLKLRNNSPHAINNNYGVFRKQAYLREDTSSQQVFMHQMSQNFESYCGQSPSFSEAKEVEIYDFSLNVNDTLVRCTGSYKIREKHYEDVINSDTLVKFNEDYQEGIGGFLGPTRYFNIVDNESVNLQCVSLYGEIMYGNCTAELMNMATVAVKKPTLHIYPNLVDDVVTIDSPSNQGMVIYNLVGNSVFTQKLVKGKNTIDLTHLKPQFYLIKAVDDTGDMIVKKIMKL